MNANLPKSFTVSRGFTYSYLYSRPQNGKPTLLLAHGFPCTSYDWRYQIAYFRPLGYGLIVPDMLGYGGTSKPTDMDSYRLSRVAKDLDELLESEDVQQAIVVGHDWGSIVAARLANYYPERFIGFAFLTVWYMPPGFMAEHDLFAAMLEKTLGYDVFSFWRFLSQPDAPQILVDHIDSFMSITFGQVEAVTEMFMRSNVLKDNLLEDRKPPRATYLPDHEWEHQRDMMAAGGFEAPLNWYKIQMYGVSSDDDKQVPKSRYTISKPAFFGASTRDPLCLAKPGAEAMKRHCPNTTIREYDAGHWAMLSHAKTLNVDLKEWVDSITTTC